MLNGQYPRGVLRESTESAHVSASHQTDSSSYRDKHCEEQTNGLDGNDGRSERVGDRAGVATVNVGGVQRNRQTENEPTSTLANGKTTTDGASNRTEATPKTSIGSGTVRSGGGTNRTRTGTITNRERESDSSSVDSEPGVAQTGQTGAGGVFSNAEEQFGAKSQFNKEKWLPVVYTPFLISHYCCAKMKKGPMKQYQHENGYMPFIGTLAEESRIRKQGWIRHGCNAFESKNPQSQPLSFWTEQDILAYIVKYNLQIADCYGEIVSVDKQSGFEMPPVDLAGNVGCNLKCTGCQRTGCVYCGFGFHLEKKGKTRFQILAELEPKKYEFALGGGQWVDNPYYDATAPEYDGEWKNWNPKQIWVPSKKGLGMKKVFDTVNEIYGKDFYRYE